MKTIKCTLSTKDLNRAISELKAYKNEIATKCARFVEQLTEHGIQIARDNSGGEYGAFITFTKAVNPSQYGATAILLATSGTITVQWMSYGKVKSADVSPLLMTEFGSGFMASDASGKGNADIATTLGMGQGTFPGQTHAFDAGGWHWQDLDGEWHSSTGIEPSMPVFSALISMEMEIISIARGVFG